MPKAEIDSVITMRKCEGDYQITAILNRDSVIYQLFQLCPSGDRKIVHPGKGAVNATFKGGGEELRRFVEKDFQSERYFTDSDPGVLLNGVVNPDGSLSDLKLVESESSPFTDFILKRLEDTAKSWLPTIQGGRPVRSVVRFYIRLNEDMRLEVATSPLPSIFP